MVRQVKIKRDAEKEAERGEQKGAPNLSAKLPKFTIAHFNGSHLDWQRFFNQFDAEIDKLITIPAVTKFSYLKEFLKPAVRQLIDSLPFTSEGYVQAKWTKK